MALIGQVNTTEAHHQNAARGAQHPIAIGNDNTIWCAYGNWDNPDNGVLASYSIDGGLTWTEEVPTTERCASWAGISLAIDSNNVPHIIYETYDAGPGIQIIRCVSRIGGVWGAPETVYNTGFAAGVWMVKAQIDSLDNIHVIYERNEVNWIVGVPGGPWSVPEVVDAASFRPDLAINNNDEPVVVYVNAVGGIDIKYRTGGAWTAADNVSPVLGGGGTAFPILQIDSVDDYHVAWSFEEALAPWNYEVYYKKKETGVWLALQELDTDVDEWHTELGIDDEDNAYVIFQLDSGGADEAVYYRKITNGIVLGVETVIDATILHPNGESSVFGFLYHKYPARGVLAATFQPVVVLLDEVPIGFPYANVNFYAASAIVFLPTVQTLPATGVV